METTQLSPLADALLEHGWLLCSPGEAIARIITEYADVTSQGNPFLWGDDEVTPADFVTALAEIVAHFRSRDLAWGDEELI